MWTLWGFFCLGCLLIAAFRTLKAQFSPEQRKMKEELKQLHQRTDELLGRK